MVTVTPPGIVPIMFALGPRSTVPVGCANLYSGFLAVLATDVAGVQPAQWPSPGAAAPQLIFSKLAHRVM
jgi:hypothetical protein